MQREYLGMSGKASISEQKPRRRWLRILLISIGIVASIVLLVVYLAFRTPTWYEPQPPPVTEAEKQDIRNLLTDAEQAFTHSLIAGKPFTYRIYDEYLNQWIAMRHEIYPRVDDGLPVALKDPFIRFLPGEIHLGARGQVAGIGAVVSAEVTVAYEDDEIVLRLGDISCGSLPAPTIPKKWREQARVDYAFDEAWRGSPTIRGDIDSGVRIGAEGRWQNGGTRYRVTDVRVLDGVLELDVTPLPR